MVSSEIHAIKNIKMTFDEEKSMKVKHKICYKFHIDRKRKLKGSKSLRIRHSVVVDELLAK